MWHNHLLKKIWKDIYMDIKKLSRTNLRRVITVVLMIALVLNINPLNFNGGQNIFMIGSTDGVTKNALAAKTTTETVAATGSATATVTPTMASESATPAPTVSANAATTAPTAIAATATPAPTQTAKADNTSNNRNQGFTEEDNKEERRAVLFSYIDLGDNGRALVRTESEFRSYISKCFTRVKKMNMNDVVVHVRPMSDAYYDSKYFPSSYYITGKQGKKMKYDPLKIMVQIAHSKGLKIEAWINPYRVTLNTTSYSSLSSDNPAKKWHNTAGKKRNVLAYNGQLFYNPSKSEVRKLIINGVKELVTNYDVDGVHMDDYFYPSLSHYTTDFDAKEYENYRDNNGSSALGIIQWRRQNVNKLVKGIYNAIKAINENVQFGISPAGNIDNLTAANMYYVDIEKWTRNTGYVDYIAPQIYWDFDYGQYSYSVFDTSKNP